MKRIRKQLLEVVASQGGKHDIVQDRSCLTNRLQLTHQWMRRVHFVIPVGADQHQMLHIGLAQQILDQIQRRSVEPLQIVEKQRQGMFRPSKNADKSAEHHVKPASRVLRQKFRDGWLVSYNEPQLGNQIHNELSVRI